MAPTWTQPGSPASLAATWSRLPRERRMAAGAAAGLFLSLFLPWYQETVIAGAPGGGLRSLGTSVTGWGAFSFVEAAVLLVAVGVLALLYFRARGRAFHLPGGDGTAIMAAGAWTCVLVLWRIFDRADATSGHGRYLTSTGVEWGIFVALAIAGLLAYAGAQVRRRHEPEPPLPGEPAAPPVASPPAPSEPQPGATEVHTANTEEVPTVTRRPRSPSPLFEDLETLELQDPPTATLRHTPAPPRPDRG